MGSSTPGSYGGLIVTHELKSLEQAVCPGFSITYAPNSTVTAVGSMFTNNGAGAAGPGHSAHSQSIRQGTVSNMVEDSADLILLEDLGKQTCHVASALRPYFFGRDNSFVLFGVTLRYSVLGSIDRDEILLPGGWNSGQLPFTGRVASSVTAQTGEKVYIILLTTCLNWHMNGTVIGSIKVMHGFPDILEAHDMKFDAGDEL
ncbi:hypothetical protein GGI35DRAFT_490285 [Trichoderma velutinum]